MSASNDPIEIDEIFAEPQGKEAPVSNPVTVIRKANGAKSLQAQADEAEQEALRAEEERYRLEADGADRAEIRKAEAARKAKKAEATRLKKAAAAEARKGRTASRTPLRAVPDSGSSDLPQISLDDQPAAVRDIHRLLHSPDGPDVYLRGTDLVTLAQKDGSKTLVPMNPARLANLVAKHAEVTCTTREGVRRVLVPPAMGAVVLSDSDWDLPVVKGITPVPLMRADGSFNTTPGYDRQTRYFYEPRHEVKISDEPTDREVAAARSLLVDQVLADFPWMDRSDKAAFLGMLFIPILRGLTEAPTPLFLVNAHDPGTGKTLLMSIPDMIYGHDELTWKNTDTEMSKQITSALCSASSPIVRCDNVPAGYEIGFASVDRLVTSKEWGDRLLGQSQQVQVPNGRLWVFNGNNIKVGKDTARRTVWCRLAAKGRPTDRRPEDFVLGDLEPWLEEHVDQVLHALLTLARGWALAGSPRSDHYISSFGPWAGMLGGLLGWLGVEGWLEGRDRQVFDQDSEGAEWEAFLHAWHRCCGSDLVKVSELKLKSHADHEEARQLREAFVVDESGELPNDKKLGRWLSAREGRKYGLECYEIQRVKDTRTRTYRYRVVRDEKKASEIEKTRAQREAAERLEEQRRIPRQQTLPPEPMWEGEIPGLLKPEEVAELRASGAWDRYIDPARRA